MLLTMLQFLWFYLWNVIIFPFFIVFTKPFNNWTFHTYIDHVVTNQCDIRHTLTADEPLIPCGYILANHRSWTDLILDPCIAKSSIVGRGMAVIAMNFAACLGILDGVLFILIRGKETRQELFNRVKAHIEQHKTIKRMLFCPEGTRMKYKKLESADELKTYLKYGLLKSIYEDKSYPVQLQISNNKEFVIDEKKWILNRGISVHTHHSKAIYPKDFNTEAEFYDEIARVWYECYLKTHSQKND
jgi:hypothetical protein